MIFIVQHTTSMSRGYLASFRFDATCQWDDKQDLKFSITSCMFYKFLKYNINLFLETLVEEEK